MSKNKYFWIAALALLTFIVFLFFRLYKLNEIPVFVDEAIYVRWSQVMRAEPSLRFLPQSDGKQPLFMWATMPALKLISDPLIAGRLVSVVAGLGSMIGVGALAYILFADPFIALFSSIIYAVIPFTMFFDRMALADGLLAMFGVWSLVFGLKFAKTLKVEFAIYLGFALGGGLLTKSPAMVFYLWSLLAILLFIEKKSLKKHPIRFIWGIFLAVVISQIMYAILRLGVNFQLIGARNQDYVYSLREVLGHPLVPFLENLGKTGNWLFLLFTPTVLILGVLGILNHKVRKQYFFLILVALLPLLYQAFIAKVYTSRYILYAVYPLIPLAGLGLHWLFSRRGILIKASIVLFLAFPILITLLYLFQPGLAPMPFDMHHGYLSEWTAGYGQRDVAQYLTEAAKGLPENKQVVVFTEGFFGTLPDGLQIYTQGNPKITVVGSDPNIAAIPDGLLKTDPGNMRYFVFNSSRNHLSPEELALMELINQYPKVPRWDGTHDSLLFYRLK